MNNSILNGSQAREYNRAQKMQTFFDSQSAIYSLSPAFNGEIKLFFSNNKQLQSYISGKKDSGKGITVDKSELKKDISEAAAFICGAATAYAIKAGDNNLKNDVDYSEAVIEKMKDGDILGFVTAIVSIVTPLLSNDDFSTGYSITPNTLSDVMKQATDYNSTIGKSKVVNNNSGIASRNINKVLKAIRDNIVQFNLLLPFFKKKYPDFVNGYRKAILIDDTGIRHNGIEGVITNSSTGAAIEGVTVVGTGTNKKTESAGDGTFRLIRFRSGNRTFTFTAPGYESQTVTIKIMRGKILPVNISLQTQIITISATA